ncbi:hypothetical protein FRC01_003468 [Tulasnella sp. 417]|nr:hypothetical protein FRC01_003468 [Tulasnella sp. 417]
MLESNSSLTVAASAAAGALVVGYYYAKKNPNTRRPPVVPYTIPWLGSAITLGKDPDAFFQDARERYGDIFTVQAAGMRSTYVTSASAISAIYRNSKSFVFTPTRLDCAIKMFDMPHSIVYEDDFMIEKLFPLHHRVLAPSNVAPMVDALIKHTTDIVKESSSQIPGNQCSTTLEEFAHRAVFKIISAAMFGPKFPAEKAYDPFLVFDDYIPFFAAGAPALFVQKGVRARTQLIDLFEEYLRTPGWEDGAAEIATAVAEGARNESQPPWTDRELATAINSDFWAANGNMSWGFFWCINLMLHEPQSLAPLYEEVDSARDSWLKAHPSADLSGDSLPDLAEFLGNASLPLVTSTVSEALRVSSSSFSIRTVVEDGVTINGYPQFEFGKGDMLVCQTRSVHLDQEIYGPDAAVFKPDRFLDSGIVTEGGSRKPFLPFGGGVSQQTDMPESSASLTVATTTAAGAIAVGYYYVKKKFNRRSPPVVPYTIPWLGSAITLGKDPDAFFQDARMKYGDIFTVQAAGMRSTYVTSAPAISAIYRNSKSFVFTPTRLDFSVKLFDMPRSIVYDNDYMTETMFPLHHRILAPSNVAPMVDALVEHTVGMVKELSSQISGNQWSTTLEEFAHKAVFRAISATMFGPRFPAEKAYGPFLVFDDYVPFFAAGAPALFVQKGVRARAQLIEMFEDYLGTPGWEQGAAEIITAIVDGARNESQPPWTDRELATAVNSDFWAANGNMSWGFFWCINLMLHEPQSLAPLYEELDTARESWLKAHPGADLSGDNLTELGEFLSNASLPLISSTVSESLRVSSSSFSIRTVVEDGVTINGYPQFEFGKGDVLVCQTRSVHLDQEIYGPDAAEFKPDRFLDSAVVTEGGSRKPFLSFGGGVSQCEGRHFAVKGCKFVLALFLLDFDIKLDPAHETPSSGSALFDMTRIGSGILHPTKPTHILVSKR